MKTTATYNIALYALQGVIYPTPYSGEEGDVSEGWE